MARNDARQTTASARCVLRRALTVIGGAAAGTAIAWFLSSTSASAETPSLIDVPAVVQEIAAPVTAPLAQVADTAVRQLQDPISPPEYPLRDLGQQVTDTAKQFGEHAERKLPQRSRCDNACSRTEKTHEHAPVGTGRVDVPIEPAFVPVETELSSDASDVLDVRASRSAQDRAFTNGMSLRGSQEPVLSGGPDAPSWPAPKPFQPAGIPTAGSHGSTGNAADSHLSTALSWQNRGVDLVARGIATATDAATTGRPGAQPGVAPD